MKKYINKISIIALGLVLLGSCKKDYLTTSPTDSVADAAVFTTTSNAAGALNGIHRLMYVQYSSQDQGGQGSVMIFNDMLGEDLVLPSSGNGWWNSQYQWVNHRTVTAGNLGFVYRFYYLLIANANLIIENIDRASGTQAERNRIKAEALTYRAWAHLQLVQFFASRYVNGATNTQLGIPLMTRTTTEPQARSTVEQVYTSINADLDAATAAFSGTATRTFKSHFDVAVAKGIKARVALTQGNWATAAQFASEARTGYSLMTNTQYQAGFNTVTNPEWMWGSFQQDDQTTYFYHFFAYMSCNFSSTNIRSAPKCINSALYTQISSTDVRKGLWDPTGTNTAFPIPTATSSRFPYMHRKFKVAGTTSVGDVPYMRVAEMYLIEAEAKARLGLPTAAQDALYTLVVNRDPSYVKSTNSGTTLIDEIMKHRRIELWGEGFRFTDLKRTNAPLDRTGSNHTAALATVLSVPAGDKQWQFLFPQAELDANKLIVQNDL